MSSFRSPPLIFDFRGSQTLLLTSLLAGTLFILWSYQETEKGVDYYNSFYRPPDKVDQPYQHGPQPNIPRLFFDNDSYMRFLILEDMRMGHDFRWHWTHADNTPYGRYLEWTIPYNWCVQSMTYLSSWTLHLPYHKALEFTASWINPLLQVLLIISLTCYLPKFLGNVITALIVLLCASQPGLILVDYRPFRCDHDSLFHLTFLAALIPVLLHGVGWTKRDSASIQQAKRAFILSGIMLGIGIRIGAARATVAWTMAGTGILASLWFAKPLATEGKEFCHNSHLWQLWGRTAASTSLLGYLLEYFPNNFHLTSIEMNTPLHALSIFCAGELFALTAQYLHGSEGLTNKHLTVICALVIGLLILPVLTIFGPLNWVPFREPDVVTATSYLGESLPLLKLMSWGNVCDLLGILLFLPFLVLFLMALFPMPVLNRAQLLFSGVSQFLLLMLYLFHMYSWCYFLNAALIVNLIAICVAFNRVSLGQQWRTGFIVALPALLLCQSLYFTSSDVHRLRIFATQNEQNVMNQELETAAVLREVAVNLKLANPGRKLHLMTSNSRGIELSYFADAETVGTIFEESVHGISAGFDFFSDTGNLEKAKKIALSRRIDYVIVDVDLNFLIDILRHEAKRPRKNLTLGEHLCLQDPIVPDWLEPLPNHPDLIPAFPLPIRVYRVNHDLLTAMGL